MLLDDVKLKNILDLPCVKLIGKIPVELKLTKIYFDFYLAPVSVSRKI